MLNRATFDHWVSCCHLLILLSCFLFHTVFTRQNSFTSASIQYSLAQKLLSLHSIELQIATTNLVIPPNPLLLVLLLELELELISLVGEAVEEEVVLEAFHQDF